MKTSTAKGVAFLVATGGGIMWWFYRGADHFLWNTGLNAFLDQFRGHGFFSVETVVLWFLVLSFLLYPPIIWFCACMTVLHRRFITETAFTRGALYVWFAPVTFTLGLACILLFRVVVGIGVRLFWLGTLVLLLYVLASAAVDWVRRR